MKYPFSKLLLCAAIGAIFSSPIHAQESDPTSITVLLKAPVTSLEKRDNLSKSPSTALVQLKQIAPDMQEIYPIPLTYSRASIEAMERHKLTRYYTVDTRDKSTEQVDALLKELTDNPLVESAQITLKPVGLHEGITVLPAAEADMRNGIPDHRYRQRYMHAPQPVLNYKLGGLNAEAARAYPGGYGEHARIISNEIDQWAYDHVDLPYPFIQHWGPEYHRVGSHDTSSAGIMFSKNNGFGTTGFAPEAKAGYTKYGQGGLFDLSKYLQPGDVIQIGVQYVYGNSGFPAGLCGSPSCYMPVEANHAVSSEISYLTEEKGVHVILAAANGSIDLDHAYFQGHYDRKQRDTGAIYVGAGNPLSGKRSSFSEYGSRVDLFSWGSYVTSTTWSESNPTQDYTHLFSGTSSANPIIAGAVAQVQSIAFAAGLGAIPPKKMRQLLVETGKPLPDADPQRPIGMQPDILAAVEKLLGEETTPRPEAVTGSDINVVATTSAGFAYKLDGSKSLHAAKYQWEKLSGPFDLRLADQAKAEAVVRKGQTGESTYQLTVTSKEGMQDSSKVTVTAVAPKASISGASSVTQGQAASLKAEANFAGASGSAPAYAWTVHHKNGVEALKGAAQQLNLSTLAVGSYQATVEISSPHGGRKATSRPHDIEVVKKAENRPPVASISGPAQADAGASVTLDAAGSTAAHGAKLRYSWTVSPHLVFNASGAKLSFTAPKLTQAAIYQFTVSVSDGALSSRKTHAVLVNKAPGEGVEGVCLDLPQWEKKQYKGGSQVQKNGRSYTAKWFAEPHHAPGAAGWQGEPWKDNGVCK